MPQRCVTPRAAKDCFCLVASDGVFDVLSHDEACQIVWAALEQPSASGESSGAEAACGVLVAEALARGSQDNASAAVVVL